MAIWSVKPVYKKSIIERQTWENGGDSFVYETGWRWGEFHVTTEDDNPPVLEEGVDLFNCDYEVELIETSDGCWDDYDYDNCSDETREKLEEFFDDGGSIFDIEEEGWYNSETEMIINCEMEIELVEPTGEKVEESEDEPKSKWPF
jgi:hypothetical protein